jgi:hypothetical protein
MTPLIGDNGTLNLDNATRVLRDVVRDAINNPYYGIRARAGLFQMVDTDTDANAYTLLDDCMSQLDPLEALLNGPEQLYALQ